MATPRVLVSGHWHHDQQDGRTRVHMWCIGQQVNVQPRTWPGMNRPGGHGRITKLHYAEDGQIVSMDVKYTLSGGSDKNLEPYLVEPWQDLDRSGRRHEPRTSSTRRTATMTQKTPGQPSAADPAAASSGPEKENAPQPLPQPPQQQQRRRPGLKPLASFKKPKKVESHPPPAASPSSVSASSKRVPPVPRVVYANDDEWSMVSELDVGAGVDDAQRCYTTDWSSSSDASKKRPAPAARARLHSLETTGSPGAPHDPNNNDASQVSRRSSPCSNARSIVSGQLSVVARRSGALHSPGLERRAASSSTTSPSAAKCLAVGQVVATSPTAAALEGPCALRSDAAPSPRSKLPPAPAKLYVSELQPVQELAWGGDSSQVMMDHRDDEEDKHGDEPDPQPLDDTMSCSSDCPRRNLFVLSLVDLLQENDGVLDEDGLLDLVNRHVDGAALPFDAANLSDYLDFLCSQNKIMRNDGQIYGI